MLQRLVQEFVKILNQVNADMKNNKYTVKEFAFILKGMVYIFCFCSSVFACLDLCGFVIVSNTHHLTLLKYVLIQSFSLDLMVSPVSCWEQLFFVSKSER